MKQTPHISVKAETLFHMFGIPITNSLLTALIVVILFALVALYYQSAAQKKEKGGVYYFISFILKSLYTLFETIFHDKAKVFFPFLASLFFFILLQNWFGLLPGVGSLLVNIPEEKHAEVSHETKSGHEPVVDDHATPGHAAQAPLFRAGTADLNTTIALALLTVALIQYYGVKYLGWKEYLRKFIDFRSPLAFFTGILETISELSKVISFSFRLFGNVFAGEVLIAIIAFLIPVLASFPFLLLEVFVGFIQAIVFTMLAAAFINLAITKHH